MKERPAYDNLPAKQSRWDLIPTSWPNLAHPINHTFGSIRHPLGDASQNLLERCPRPRHNSVATVETGDGSAEHLTRERPADSAPCFACCAVLRAALDRKDATVLLVITTFSHLRLVGRHHCCLLNLALANAGCAARCVGDGTLFTRAFCSKR